MTPHDCDYRARFNHKDQRSHAICCVCGHDAGPIDWAHVEIRGGFGYFPVKA